MARNVVSFSARENVKEALKNYPGNVSELLNEVLICFFGLDNLDDDGPNSARYEELVRLASKDVSEVYQQVRLTMPTIREHLQEKQDRLREWLVAEGYVDLARLHGVTKWTDTIKRRVEEELGVKHTKREIYQMLNELIKEE